jgi:hypothetical protein
VATRVAVESMIVAMCVRISFVVWCSVVSPNV